MMAGEPETLFDAGPLAERIERHNYDRLLMLSDGVFAIAITLLALELPNPAHWDGRMDSLFLSAGRPLVGYFFAFLMVGSFWLFHRRMFAQLVRVDQPATLMNLLLLGLIGLAPFVARLIAESGPSKGMVAYFAIVAAVGAVQVLLWAYADWAGLIDQALPRATRRLVLIQGLVPVILLGGIAAHASRGDGRISMETLTLALAVVAATRLVTRARFRI